MISRSDELACLHAAIEHCNDRTPDHQSRADRNINWLGYVKQMAESMAAEWFVAKRLGYEYTPGSTWDKSVADVGDHIEVKWSENPVSGLWIQKSDRADRDIAILVTGVSPEFYIHGWIPVAVAKKDRYWISTQQNWCVTQANLQPIETLQRSNYAHSRI